MTLKFICFPLPSTRPAPEHLSFPLGSPLLCFILTWARADQTFSSRFFSSSSPPSAAEALQLVSRFQCFMYNAAGPFIKVKMSVRAEGRPEVQGQRDLTAERGGGAVWPRFNQNKPLYHEYWQCGNLLILLIFCSNFSIYNWILEFHVQFLFHHGGKSVSVCT